MTLTLQNAPLHVPLRIVAVEGVPGSILRVKELGLIEGAVIVVRRRALFGGPLDIQVRQTRVGLRASTDVQISVELLAVPTVA